MLRLIKKLLHISTNQVDEIYLKVLAFEDKKISFVLQLETCEQAELLLLELVKIEHTKNCHILVFLESSSVVVDISFDKKRNNKEAYKLIVDILEKQQEIKTNGKSNRES